MPCLVEAGDGVDGVGAAILLPDVQEEEVAGAVVGQRAAPAGERIVRVAHEGVDVVGGVAEPGDVGRQVRQALVHPGLFVRVQCPMDHVLELVSDRAIEGGGANLSGVGGIQEQHLALVALLAEGGEPGCPGRSGGTR